MAKPILTAARLRELLHYDPATGVFTWITKSSVKSRITVGSQAGSLKSDTHYFKICIEKSGYYSHRLAWLYMTGNWPEGEIDHIDGMRTNNIYTNLRDVNSSINRQNQRNRNNTKTGLLGARPNGKNRWAATIEVEGKARHLGQFSSPELAHHAYLKAKRLLHQGCTI